MTKIKKIPAIRFSGFTEEWEERKLIDVKDNEDRYSYTGGPFGSDLKSSDYTEIGVRIIQLQNIGDGKFVNDYKIYTSEEKARSLNSNLIYPGEIIIAKMADPLARATILPKIEPKYLMASDGIRLKINTDYFDNYYILTLINSDVFRKEALNNSTGTTRKRIGLVTLGNLPMMIPSFEEQQKIGTFFKQLDDTIALHQRKLDLLKEQKKGYLQKMFPKKGEKVPKLRFAGFADDWEERKLKDVLDISKAKNKAQQYGKVDVLSVSREVGTVNQIKYQGRSFAGSDLSNYKVVQGGELIYTKSPLKGAPYGIFQVATIKGILSPLYAVYTSTDKAYTPFVAMALKNDNIATHYLTPLVTKGAKNTINVTDEGALEGKIQFPSILEQKQIFIFFKQLDDTIALHQRKLDLLKEQKKGYLQKMFV